MRYFGFFLPKSKPHLVGLSERFRENIDYFVRFRLDIRILNIFELTQYCICGKVF
jgi:hypothetical protein